MLIPSERHTAADLSLWSELEATDLAHYDAGRVEGKAEQAIRVLADFAAGGPCYASVSWGKDSVVLAHLVWRSGLGVPLGNVAQHGVGSEPHIPAVRDAFLASFRLPYTEASVPLGPIPDDGGHSPALDLGIGLLRKCFGTPRYIGGVRAEESGVRKIGMRARGLATQNTCQPLGWWCWADVFAYLARYRLPVHPSYAMLGGGRWDRRHIRVSTIGGPKGNQFGRAEWEREYYGDVLRRLHSP
jgi:phosphoadenosine phosphosulfate reductase